MTKSLSFRDGARHDLDRILGSAGRDQRLRERDPHEAVVLRAAEPRGIRERRLREDDRVLMPSRQFGRVGARGRQTDRPKELMEPLGAFEGFGQIRDRSLDRTRPSSFEGSRR